MRSPSAQSGDVSFQRAIDGLVSGWSAGSSVSASINIGLCLQFSGAADMTSRTSLRIAVPALAFVGAAALFHATGQDALAKKAFLPIRFHFEFAPDTPLADMLPEPPKLAQPPLRPIDDPAQAPEIAFGEPVPKDAKDTMRETAHVLAKINHVNVTGQQDAFMRALLADRADLRGLPFVMDDACRTSAEESKLLGIAVRRVRDALLTSNGSEVPSEVERKLFWASIDLALEGKDPDGRLVPHPPKIEPALVAALAQMITPIAPVYGPELPQRLARIAHADAGKALAKLALYAPDEAVRSAAIAGLKSRPAAEYEGLLLDGFRYPLPAVADRAAAALTQLERKDVARKLVDILEAPDPRTPREATVDGKKVSVIRELVRINHHRNCVLCHAPASGLAKGDDPVRGEVPMPDESLGNGSLSYGFGRSPDILVRIDVNYLRQDFSLALAVKNSAPWPANQRFDYLVRTRQVSDEEAKQFAARLAQSPQPFHRAALAALRSLTGRDASSPSEWRKSFE
jgi:hypothetical protein